MELVVEEYRLIQVINFFLDETLKKWAKVLVALEHMEEGLPQNVWEDDLGGITCYCGVCRLFRIQHDTDISQDRCNNCPLYAPDENGDLCPCFKRDPYQSIYDLMDSLNNRSSRAIRLSVEPHVNEIRNYATDLIRYVRGLIDWININYLEDVDDHLPNY